MLLQPRCRNELASLLPALVELPADIPVPIHRGRVVASRRPQNPFSCFGVHEQGENLRPIREAMPTDRSIAIGCENIFAPTRNVDAPSDFGSGLAPHLLAVSAKHPEAPFRAQHDAIAAGRDRYRPGNLMRLKLERLSVELRAWIVKPVCDLEACIIGNGKAGCRLDLISQTVGNDIKQDRLVAEDP